MSFGVGFLDCLAALGDRLTVARALEADRGLCERHGWPAGTGCCAVGPEAQTHAARVRGATYAADVSDERSQAVAAELLRIQEEPMHGAQTQVSSAKCWRGLVAIGVPRPRSLLLAVHLGWLIPPMRTPSPSSLSSPPLRGLDGCDDYAQRGPARRTIRVAANAYLSLHERLPLAPG